MNPFRHRKPLLLLCLGVLVGGAVLLGMHLWNEDVEREPLAKRQSFPEHPRPKSEYLNTAEGVGYIGSKRCQECHQGRYRSWEKSAHAKALSVLDVQEEPPEGEFEHAASGRRYRVVKRGGTMYHEERAVRPGGVEILLHSLPIKYVVGSGRYSKSYFLERDGFLVESPITWYHQPNAWGISPGYDTPSHTSFRRTISYECLLCHSGIVEPDEKSRYHTTLRELAVGCERCHGPGELHADAHTKQDAWTGERDLTIVNPERLSRKLTEAICSDCHLGLDATVPARGKRIEDFRPGLPLSAFRHEYRLVPPDSKTRGMTVTGHVEQMRASPCWKKDSTFTCTTCHDPHRPLTDEEKPSVYRRICLECHSCRMPEPERLGQVSNDSCVTCHMPNTPTDLPHFAFTHHRVGIYRTSPVTPSDKLIPRSSLQAFGDQSHLGKAEREYLEGLASLQLAEDHPFEAGYAEFKARGTVSLLNLLKEGFQDEHLTRLQIRGEYTRGELKSAQRLAKRLLSLPRLSTQSRIEAHIALAHASMKQAEWGVAAKHFLALTELRYEPQDWLMLGICYQRQGDPKRAIDAIERAAKIDPAPGIVHQQLFSLYSQVGNAAKANRHRQLMQQLPPHGFDHIPENPK